MAAFVLQQIVLAHLFSAPPGWVCNESAAPRLHHGLIYVMSGQMEYRQPGRGSLVLRAGDCLYIPQGTPYVTRNGGSDAFVHRTVNFSIADGGQIFPAPTRCHVHASTRFEQVFSQLARHWAVRHPHYRERCLGLLYELVYLFLQEQDALPRQHLQKLQPARAYLDEHFCENFPLEKLPELCDLSETYFRRLFRSVFHETPGEYRTRLRMARAGDLLLSGLCGVKQAGLLCGYDDPAYFSRIFRKTMGQSPAQYVRSHQKALPPEDAP